MQYIKQNTSAVIQFGPIVKSTDGYSPLTGITSGTATASVLFVYNGTSTGGMTTAFSWDEMSTSVVQPGCYALGLASSPIGSLGHLRIYFQNSSAIPTYEDVRILSANVYDSLISTSDYLLVDMQQIGGSSGEINTGMLDVNVQQVGGATMGGNVSSGYLQTDAQNVVTTASNMNVGAVAGTTVPSATAFQADVSGLSVLTTANNMNIGAVAGTTVQSATAFQADVSGLSVLTSASNINVGAVAGSTVAGVNDFKADVTNMSTFDASSETVNVGEIAGETITTDAADNWDNFWFNNDVVSTERVGDLPTTVDMISTNTVYDVWTHGDLMKLLQSHILGNTTYDGTTYVVYTHGGTTFVKYAMDTAYRTRTT
jgi:hypothetical protein